MIGLVMCGGKGVRMKSLEEKLLLKYKKPIIQHVLYALENSRIFSKIVCATSNNAPRTRGFVDDLGVDILGTQGKGYVEDLRESLINFAESVFVVPGDMPLLDSEIIRKIKNLINEKNAWSSILVRKNFLKSLGFEAEYFLIHKNEECAYTGISVVNPFLVREMEYVSESNIILDDKRIATNLNTMKDYDLLCTT